MELSTPRLTTPLGSAPAGGGQVGLRGEGTTLILVRHGHVADNDPGVHARLCGWIDPPLSALGREQVARVAARLAEEPPVQAIYASTLTRARQTAEGIGARLGQRVWLRKSLRELGCGALDGWPVEQVKERFPELWQRNLEQTDERFRWPAGESYRGFRARSLRAIRRIAAAHAGGRVVVVTHTGVISQVVGSLVGASAARWEMFRAGNASVSEIRWQGEGGELVRFDERTHLVGPVGVPEWRAASYGAG